MEAQNFAASHAAVIILAAIIPALTRALRDDVAWFRTADSPGRLVILGVLTCLGTAIDQVQNGLDWRTALVAAVVSGGPGLVIELAHLFGGGGKGPGTGDIDLVAAEKKAAPPYSTKCIALVLAAVLPGCSQIRAVEPVAADVAAKVLQDVEEAQQWIVLVESVAAVFLHAAHASPEVEAAYNKADQAVRLALLGVTRAANATGDAAKGSYDAALAEFRAAYEAFLGVAKSIGVVSAKGTMMVARNGRPEPVEAPQLRLLAVH